MSRFAKLPDLKLSLASEVGMVHIVVRATPRAGQPRPQTGQVTRAVNRNPSSHHILLVEDHPAVLNATRLLLKSAGYRVTTATSLAEAVEHTSENPDLDLVITDYHLTGSGTGKQVVSSVRELRGLDFKAIVITGDTASAVHQFDSDRGLCWIRKPVDPAQLLTLLQSLLA